MYPTVAISLILSLKWHQCDLRRPKVFHSSVTNRIAHGWSRVTEIWLCTMREISLSFWTARPQRWRNLGLLKVIFWEHINEIICHISKWDGWNEIKEGTKRTPNLVITESECMGQDPIYKSENKLPFTYLLQMKKIVNACKQRGLEK